VAVYIPVYLTIESLALDSTHRSSVTRLDSNPTVLCCSPGTNSNYSSTGVAEEATADKTRSIYSSSNGSDTKEKEEDEEEEEDKDKDKDGSSLDLDKLLQGSAELESGSDPS
jgi:hypothetical protein